MNTNEPSRLSNDRSLWRAAQRGGSGGPAMQMSRDRILTTHAGSLPRPDALIAANHARESGVMVDDQRFQDELSSAVEDVVRQQQKIGIDIPGDGEFGKSMGHRVNYRA